MIYFVQGPEGGRIKIGTTLRLSHRIRQLNADGGLTLRVLGIMEGHRDEEQTLLGRFAHCRAEGEWFEPATDLVEFIASETQPWDGIDEDELLPRFAAMMRQARRLKGWTQDETARELGVFKQRVSGVERGRVAIGPAERLRWAVRLGIPPDRAAPELVASAGPPRRALVLIVDGSGRVSDPAVVVPAGEADVATLENLGWPPPHRWEVGNWGFLNLARSAAREGVRIELAYDLPPLA